MGDLPVRQYVVIIPNMLRLFYKYDRKLLGLLSQCLYASVKQLFQDAAGNRRSLPGMLASLQSYGDDPTRFHPHLHSLATDGLVSVDGSFVAIPCPDPACLMQLFQKGCSSLPCHFLQADPRPGGDGPLPNSDHFLL